MRLWTLHPHHLDGPGLVALWREGLLARAVLRGRTRGYRHHPQLARFRAHPHPVAALNSYLEIVLVEAERRGYSFDGGKIRGARTTLRIPATRGQLEFEWQHLLRKLERRVRIDRSRKILAAPRAHPSFRVRAGPIEAWEAQRNRRSGRAKTVPKIPGRSSSSVG